MPRKTLKQRRNRQRTLRKLRKGKKRGGALEGQALAMPSSSFGAPIGAPVNSDNAWHKIA